MYNVHNFSVISQRSRLKSQTKLIVSYFRLFIRSFARLLAHKRNFFVFNPFSVQNEYQLTRKGALRLWFMTGKWMLLWTLVIHTIFYVILSHHSTNQLHEAPNTLHSPQKHNIYKDIYTTVSSGWRQLTRHALNRCDWHYVTVLRLDAHLTSPKRADQTNRQW